MIHVLTVHWKDDKWIDTQLEYLSRNLSEEHMVYAFLNHISHEHDNKFYFVSHEEIASHAIKLNLLANMASFNAKSEDDILLFIDGDAFPVVEISEFLSNALKDYPLVAVQRHENSGDIQPHPCFCATTVKFWQEIGGDWKDGYEWHNSNNERVTDVGGNLLKALSERNISWMKMLRSNKTNLHPLWFGVYGDCVYHHGAGFRAPVSRVDMGRIRIALNKALPSSLKQWLKSNDFVRNIINSNAEIGRVKNLSEVVFDKLKNNSDFYKEFI